MTVPETSFPPERLPYVVIPLPGEALDSWIEAYARELIVTSHDFLSFIGLPRAHPERLAVQLLPEEADTLAKHTGVSREQLRAMTLEPLDGITVRLRQATRGLASPPRWRRHKGSRFCPSCLADTGGRWQLDWRSPWAFACPRHQVLLIDDCPAGGHRPHPAGRHPAGVTSASRCTMARDLPGTSALARRPCGADLTSAQPVPLPADGLILVAQQYADKVVRHEPRRHRVQRRLGEIFYLGWRALAALHDQDEPPPLAVTRVLDELGGRYPARLTGLSNEDAQHVAIGTTLAMIMRDEKNPDSDTVLAWMTRSYLQKQGQTELQDKLRSWRQVCSASITTRALRVIDTRLRAMDRLRYATSTRTPRPPSAQPEAIQRRAAMVPTTLWPSWSMRLMPPQAGGPKAVKTAEFRAALSALLLMARSTSRTYSDALALLGDPVPASFVRSMTTRLDKRHLAPLLGTLCQLADALVAHGSPIDCRRRRELAHRADLLVDRDAYRHLAAQHGWKKWSDQTFAAMDSYVRALVTLDQLSDPGPAAAGIRARRSALRFHADPHLRAFLHQQAEDHLHRLGIDEPLTWEPPRRWVKDIQWPGIDPGEVSRLAFRRHTSRNATMSEVASALGISTEHVRLYAEITGLTSQWKKGVVPRGPRTPAPSTAVLRELYEEQGLSLDQLRQQTGCSIKVLKAALKQAGIGVRNPGMDPKRIHKIDSVWLHEQYVVLLRSCADIADEVGSSEQVIRDRIRRVDIWQEYRDSVPRDFTTVTRGMTISRSVRMAFTGSTSVQRMRQLCTLLDAASLETAVRELGIPRAEFVRRLRLVETVSGVRVTKWLTPLEITAEGRYLLEEAQHVLARYADEHDFSKFVP